jgi:putative ABC transport system substrate-binding protein
MANRVAARSAAGLVVLTLGMLLTAPVTHAQSATKVYQIGTLRPGPRPTAPDWKQRWAFMRALRELGWVEGQNIVIHDRWADGRTERLPALAADLVRLKVDVIATRSWPAAVATKQATTTIPIVIAGTGDPVATGLVQSLARPGGNITGLGDPAAELSAKRLELLKDIVPKLSRVALLWNSGDGGMTLRARAVQGAARTLGVTVRPLAVQGPEDFEQAFAAMLQERPGALLVVADLLTIMHRKRIVEFATQHRVPTMWESRGFVDGGGLISYGENSDDRERRAAAYVDKILRGARPAELPVEEPTRFELVVNLKTAGALGLALPQAILLRADQVIQ